MQLTREHVARRHILLLAMAAWPGALRAEEVAPRGFRSAVFGMTEPELRPAVARDFPGLPPPARTTHPQERTTVLTLRAPGLLPDAGPAEVAYILGHGSRRLQQVNLVWRADGRTATQDQALVAGANLLRQSLSATYATAPEVLGNRPLGRNGVLAFRAGWPDGRMVLLVLAGRPATAPREEPQGPPLSLQLSYIRDHRSPDVFRIPPGQF